MLNRRIFWAAAMRDLQQAHPPAGVREERLRAAAGLRWVFDLTSWRGRSGRRYVVGVQPLTESDAAEVSEGVMIAVRRDAERVARLVDVVAAEPAFRAAERKAWAARIQRGDRDARPSPRRRRARPPGSRRGSLGRARGGRGPHS